jgi:hypothetical protein
VLQAIERLRQWWVMRMWKLRNCRRLFELLPTVDQFKQFAAYNKWANARLYAAVLDLPELSYRLHVGVFFGGLHGTLNHLLLTDRLWLNG